MQAYLGGQDVTLTIPLMDAVGEVIAATAVQYRVIDQAETELVAKTTLATFTNGDAEAIVAIPAALNDLGSLMRGLRVVELYVTTEAGVSLITVEYVIEASAVLAVGVNSFQTYPSAVLVGYELPNLPGWNEASKNERMNALMAAYRNFGKLRLRYIHEEVDEMTRAKLSAVQLDALAPEYLACLRRAQVLEADFLLGGDEAGDIRRAGIMSATIGESSQFFRTQKPIEGVVCKRAMKELSGYVINTVSVGRG